MNSWIVAGVSYEVTATLTFDHQNVISPSLSPSGHLRQIPTDFRKGDEISCSLDSERQTDNLNASG